MGEVGRSSSLCETEEGSSCDTYSVSRRSPPSLETTQPNVATTSRKTSTDSSLTCPPFEWSWKLGTRLLSTRSRLSSGLTRVGLAFLAGRRACLNGGMSTGFPPAVVETWCLDDEVSYVPTFHTTG